MKAKKLECFEVNGKIFVVEPETGILIQCQKLPDTLMPTYNEYQAIFDIVED